MARPSTARSTPPASRSRPPRRSGGGGTLLGVFIGLVIGLGMAAGVAYYLMKANGPFPMQGGKEVRETPREPVKVAKAEPAAEKPRFDFYKILPGGEELRLQPEGKKTPDRLLLDQAKDRGNEKMPDKSGPDKPRDKVAIADATPAAKPPERFWIQAGSFAMETDAENLKARLAFAGWQASVQQGVVPDKGTRFRVRLGPFDNTDELSRIKTDLARNGFDAAVIKF